MNASLTSPRTAATTVASAAACQRAWLKTSPRSATVMGIAVQGCTHIHTSVQIIKGSGKGLAVTRAKGDVLL